MSCRPPIRIDRVFDRPQLVRELVERHAPYLPVQRYFASDAEYRSGSGRAGKMIVAPNFRGDWAYEKPLIEGVEVFFEHPEFIRAAGELFGSDRVRPHSVYSNLTWQLPFDQGGGHTDVPAFRGIERTRHPVWFLQAMGHSRLFEEERVQIATAVSWFYEGEDGGFTYWPDGPDARPRVHEGAIFNTAIMGDNDFMYHRVRPVGRPEDGLLMGMTLDTSLEHRGGDDWAIAEGAETSAQLVYDELRISVSWKAYVFRDAREEVFYDEHRQDLSLDQVLQRFYDDLEERGVSFERPADPMQDPAFIAALSAVYIHEPTVFA